MKFHVGVRIYFSHQTSWCFPNTQTYLRPAGHVPTQLHLERFSETKPNILIWETIINQVKFSVHLINHPPFANILEN